MKSSLQILILSIGFFLVLSCSEDEGTTEEITIYEDNDSDGFGNPDAEKTAASLEDGYVGNNLDCDDTNASINPNATEVPDNDVDENCDGLNSQTWYRDSDGDGFGDSENSQVAVTQPGGFVANDEDCNDEDININPDADETSGNDVDENCDGIVLKLWYADVDGDTYGDPNNATESATMPTGYVSNSLDCNDSDDTVNPDGVEIKGNGIDENCDGVIAAAVCADGILDVGETCDDGNLVSGDGCNMSCQAEVCGNGTLDINEGCDDGNTDGGDGCSSVCIPEVCGNGVVDPGEGCDDGGTTNGDGCDATCTVESGWTCMENAQGVSICEETDSDGDGIPDNHEVPGCELDPGC